MRMLVTLDGSTLSEAILPAAAQLAQATAAEVHLLRVVEDPGLRRSWVEALAVSETGAGTAVYPGIDPAAAEMDARMLDQAIASAEHYLADAAARFPAGAAPRAIAGHDPAAAITQYAAENAIELIAMSTHGRSGIGRWVFGSNADKLLQSTAIPMLLVRPRGDDAPPAAPIDTLVVPLDGSRLAEESLAYAEGLASQMSLGLSLLRVVTTPAVAFPGTETYPYDPRVFSDLENEAAAYLQGKLAALEAKGLEASVTVKAGYPAAHIIDFAEESEGSLIVMSTHGRGGLGRWILGSVADRVLRAAYRPILLIRSS